MGALVNRLIGDSPRSEVWAHVENCLCGCFAFAAMAAQSRRPAGVNDFQAAQGAKPIAMPAQSAPTLHRRYAYDNVAAPLRDHKRVVCGRASPSRSLRGVPCP